ncbi:RimJ/RimL family protein N-acetyltransferase [Aquimarina sp. MAR_2010_214]|uniref:GNAT family N-acetyltransferase n=1 Tax=Aquimarina sp. MAR_2010_214 TaxID=1250026 RepID=UPI000C7136C7|nr:GNAT family N-acetyltransferase [Aquimarina sp. MAR_2010_214]PKV48977.1 RimJ/RimL family protein N-acetyltransferase [Aquimarina sp. MAR_2010_214]
MNFISKTYHTKSGKSLLVREATPADAKQLLALKLEYLKDTNTIPLFDYEYSNTVKEEGELIQNLHEQANSLLLVAESDGDIIGNIDLTGSWRKKMQHTAMIGMGIHTQCQNQGIGTLLIQNVLEWSKENELLKVLWLEVYATNIAGISLYKKMGFIPSGSIQGFFLEKEEYIDKITMATKVG